MSQEVEPLAEADPSDSGNDSALGDVTDATFVDPTQDGQSTKSASVFDAGQDTRESALVVPPKPSPKQRKSVRAQDLPGRERRRRVRLQARRVRRIVRHVEPWSVLKISIIFYLCLWVILMIAGVMLWGAAESAGVIEKIENFVQELFALDSFTINAEQIFRNVALGGFILVIAGTAFSVLLAVLFNLISDLTGGLRVTVIEEESARFRPRRGQRPSQQARRKRQQQKARQRRAPKQRAQKKPNEKPTPEGDA